MKLAFVLAPVVLAAAAPAAADVTSSDSDGFTVRVEATTTASPQAVFALFSDPARWWSDVHTWSGDAHSMTIAPPRAGGCWCEQLPEFGSVEHGHIVRWDPEHSRIIFRAELGPLQTLAVNGKLEWIAVAVPDAGTRVAFRYEVAGRGMADPAAIAGAVDAVLAEQLGRLVRVADAADAAPAH